MDQRRECRWFKWRPQVLNCLIAVLILESNRYYFVDNSGFYFLLIS